MSEPRPHPPALLVVAAFSRHPDAVAWGRERLEPLYGPIALTSAPYAFVQTAYYAESMGADLQKQFLVFRDLVPPDALPDIKLRTNAIENELAAAHRFPEERPLNLDPGILTLGKFQLATTKDQAHRIYLRDGIYAEVTLRYEAGAWVPWPWTYADYRLPEVAEFLKRARGFYKERLRDGSV
jgi:hypothetical protein